MALQGTIDTFEFTEVVRLLAAGGKSGVLRLEGSRGSGGLWVDAGKVTAIEVDHAPLASGFAEAMFELLRFDDGSFSFVAGETPTSEGDPTDVEEILVDAEVQLAEWREIEQVVPSTRAVITLRPELARADVVLDRQRWRMITAIGGGATVATVGESLGLGELPVSRAVKELIELGVVDLDDATPEEPVVVAAAPEPAPEPVPEPEFATEPVEVEAFAPDMPIPDEGGSARAQLDEFAAGFGLADAPSFGESMLDAPPLDVAPLYGETAPATDGYSDFGVDTPGAEGSDDDLFSPGSPSTDPLGDFAAPTVVEPTANGFDPAGFEDEGQFVPGGGDAAEVARQLSNLSPAAARAVAAAAKANTDEEREAALAAVSQEGDEPIDRELLLRFLASVKS